MNLQDALSLAKDYAQKHTLSFVAFFRKDRSGLDDLETNYDHVISGALIYLVIGVTLQSSYIAGVQIDQISWLDRAVGQLVFWVSIGLITHMMIHSFSQVSDKSGFLTAFRVMPTAFLCGAYASSIGFFVAHLLRLFGAAIYTLPHLFHILVQLAVIALYMPRELRDHSNQTPSMSRIITGVVFVVVFLVDMVVVFGPAFTPRAAG